MTARSNWTFFPRAAALALVSLAGGACGDDDTTPTFDAPIGVVPDARTVDAPPTVTPDAAGADAAGPPDTDFAVIRLSSNGSPDTSFGPGGVRVFDMGAGAGTTRDTVWSVARDGENRIVVFGSRKNPSRADTDRVVLRVNTDGTLDGDFGDDGVHTLDIETFVDNARNGVVQADGKIVASGYVAYPTGVGTQTANQIAILRLDDSGAPDGDFGTAGVARIHPLKPADPVTTMWGMVEAYGAVPHMGGYVTTGYGRVAASGTVDLVSIRIDAEGEQDLTWGENGVALLDLVGENDRGRNLVALGDDRVVMVGSGTPGAAANIDAMVAIYTATGDPDTTFDDDGWKLYSFGGLDEAFYGAAVSPSGNQVAVAGYATGETGGAAQDEDGTLLILPVGGGAPAEVSGRRPASDTLDDRYWSVAYDADGRIYAAGQLNDGGDNRMIVVRFTADGVRDGSFGSGGMATINVTVGGGTVEAARGVVITSDGKVVIAGNTEHR